MSASAISQFVEYSIQGDSVVLAEKTVACIERGGVLGTVVARHVREDIALVEETLGHRMRVVSPTGVELKAFASN